MVLKNLLYILQSEYYSPTRFLKFAYTHLTWWKLENRQEIIWTGKAWVLWGISVVLFWSVFSLFLFVFGMYSIGFIPILVVGLPVFVVVSLLLLFPIEYPIKQRKIYNAKKIIMESGVRVVGITGSYGKTSTKEILAQILSEAFVVIKTPENVNTDLGVADFILKNSEKFKKEGIFIVEMGAHKRGEIQKICEMVHPAYSILTGINETHLERFGSIENIIQGKFELPQYTGICSFLNFDDARIRENVARFALSRFVGVSGDEAKNRQFVEKFGGLSFEYEGTRFETVLLAEHNIALILLGTRLARELSMALDQIVVGVKKIQPLAHRLQPIYNAGNGIMVIDDSYNGNYDGVVSGLEVLVRATGRKVVLTPGLVELGARAEEVHINMGALYAKKVDLVLLVQNARTEYIVKGMQEAGFTQYKIYTTTQEAHKDLSNMLSRGDTILFQNDLTDNYF